MAQNRKMQGFVESKHLGLAAEDGAAGGPLMVFHLSTAGSGTSNTSLTMAEKVRVIDAFCYLRAAGAASDTLQVFNGSDAISDAIDVSGGANTRAAAGEMDDTKVEIAAGGTLKVTHTDAASSDAPVIDVYVLAVKVA